VVTVNCPSSTQQFRYVIVQSLDPFVFHEKVCMAEVCVTAGGQYATTIVSIGAATMLSFSSA